MTEPYYQDDHCTIYHGDCRDILPALPTPDLLLADPPYGIAIETDSSSRSRRSLGINHPPVHGDDEPFDPSHLLGASRRVVLFGANNYCDKLPPSQAWIVWDRMSGGSNTADAELAWTNLGGTVRTFRHLWNGVLRDSEIGFHVHPTQKPVRLMSWVIARATSDGDLVIDPYCGSGPTLRAAKDLGRKAIGIEIEERYCEIAAKRLAQEVLF